MGSTETKLTGPDLTIGVDASTIVPGGKLLGHAAGEAVLLARVGRRFLGHRGHLHALRRSAG
jgi:hypothetical protein